METREQYILDKAFNLLPEAKESKDQRLEFREKLSFYQIDEAMLYPDDIFLFRSGYEFVEFLFIFEKDPMCKDTKGWKHVHTYISKQTFKRQY